MIILGLMVNAELWFSILAKVISQESSIKRGELSLQDPCTDHIIVEGYYFLSPVKHLGFGP